MSPSIPETHLRSLLRQTAAGNSQAWGQLWVALAGSVGAWVAKEVGAEMTSATVEDVCSETFARLPKAAGAFRGQSKVLSFVIGIAKNALCEERRRHPRTVTIEEIVGPRGAPAVPSAEDLALEGTSSEDETLERLLVEAMSKLPPAQHYALSDEVLEGASLRATLSGNEAVAHRQNVSRARRRFHAIVTSDERYAPIADRLNP